ncbi:hypothetical protein [Methylobacillus flagellatus]|uniref:hypothetical protein n=1 Tax=Methylobacillus flagellatus TaxID=405 RepID=UPI0010F60AE5|nr:hypothetical protein [Methylobacillus flagellatus]
MTMPSAQHLDTLKLISNVLISMAAATNNAPWTIDDLRKALKAAGQPLPNSRINYAVDRLRAISMIHRGGKSHLSGRHGPALNLYKTDLAAIQKATVNQEERAAKATEAALHLQGIFQDMRARRQATQQQGGAA